MKTTLQIYTKINFGDEEICDNRPSSNILKKARTNTLQMNDRTDTQIKKEIVWYVIKMKKKIHFMLHCTAYNEERSHSTHLQQPYIERDEDILGHFLFNNNKEDIEGKKNCYSPYGKEDNIK